MSRTCVLTDGEWTRIQPLLPTLMASVIVPSKTPGAWCKGSFASTRAGSLDGAHPRWCSRSGSLQDVGVKQVGLVTVEGNQVLERDCIDARLVNVAQHRRVVPIYRSPAESASCGLGGNEIGARWSSSVISPLASCLQELSSSVCVGSGASVLNSTY